MFKKLIGLLIVLTLVFISCDMDSGTPNEDDENNDNTDIIVDKSIEVRDANDVLLGYATSVEYCNIDLITSTGYLISLDYNGTIDTDLDSLYYSEIDGGGTVFFVLSSLNASDRMNPKSVFRGNNKLYIFDTTTVDFNVVEELIGFTYNSYWRENEGTQELINSSGTLPPDGSSNYWYGFSNLKEITNTDIGLPATITGPITVNVVTD